jgi:hypothetical protein
VLASTAIVACQKVEPTPRGPADTGIVLATTSTAKDSLIRVKDSLIAEKSRQLSLQSQIIGDAATSARLVSEIDKELSKVRSLRVAGDTAKTESAEPTASEQLGRVQKKVNLLISRLNASESRLRKMRSDSATHAGFDSTQVAQLRDYERSIGELRATVERQQAEIASLNQRVDSVVKVNVALTAHTNALEAREDSVFVAIGTEKELLARGIIRKEGGTKLLFGRGKTLVTARALDPSSFQVMSRSHDLTIQLPKANRPYRMVSRQSLQFVDPPNPKDGVLKGSVKITDAVAFWGASKFLVLVEQ